MFAYKKLPFLIAVTCFLVGFYLPHKHQSHSPLPYDLRQEAGIMNLSDLSASNRRLVPYRIVIDGKAEEIPNISHEGEQWRLDLADGRVTIYASTGK